MATTTTEPSVKQYYDYAQKQIDEQAILDKYNAATLAQFNVQREQNRLNENSFYNQMYNTQRTAMDTIRQSNAAAVSTGASRGIQAANELSALLGLQQESVASATELAQANRQTAQEETAAVLENVLNAYTQAAQERSQLVTQAIEAASVDAQESANQITARETAQLEGDALQKAAETNTSAYLAEVERQGKQYKTYSTEGAASLNLALNSLTAKGDGQPNTGEMFTANDFATASARVGSGSTSTAALTKLETLKTDLTAICNTYGLDMADYTEELNAIEKLTQPESWSRSTGGVIANILTAGIAGVIETATEATRAELAHAAQAQYNAIIAKMRAKYATPKDIQTKE